MRYFLVSFLSAKFRPEAFLMWVHLMGHLQLIMPVWHQIEKFMQWTHLLPTLKAIENVIQKLTQTSNPSMRHLVNFMVRSL